MSENLRNLRAKKYPFIPEYVTEAAKSFYQHTSTNKKAYVCNGTACVTAGTQERVKGELLKNVDAKDIGEMSCLGLCHKNASFLYEGELYSLGENKSLKETIAINEPIATPNYPIHSLLLKPVESISSLYRLAGNIAQDKAIKELSTSNLRGRGGAGFPFAFKIKGCLAQTNPTKYVVCNADEGDPGAFSDKYLLDEMPHKVLAGMYATAKLIGAKQAFLYIRAEYPGTQNAVKKAIEEFENLEQFRSHPIQFHITSGHGSYVCGEETSLLNSLEGLRAEVRVRPPYPTEYGLFGRPTVLSNVETFANIPFIFENGGQAFSDLGKGKSTGTKLVSLDAHFNKPGLYEIELGMPLKELFETHAGGFRHPVKAVQVGGPLGGIVPQEKFDDLDVTFESFQEHGFLLGHASIVSIPDSFSMKTYLEHIMEFAEDESCGKCFPCRLGSKQGHEMVKTAMEGGPKMDREAFNDLLDTMEIGSLCGFGTGIPLPVKNILNYFDHELTSLFGKEG